MHRNISRHKRMMRDDVCIFFAMKCKQMVHAVVSWKLGTTLLEADLFRGYFFGAPCRLFEYEVNFFEASAGTRFASQRRRRRTTVELRNVGPENWVFWSRSCWLAWSVLRSHGRCCGHIDEINLRSTHDRRSAHGYGFSQRRSHSHCSRER